MTDAPPPEDGLPSHWTLLICVSVVLFVFGGFVPDWDSLSRSIGGALEEMIWAVGGYTLPLTAGFFTITFAAFRLAELGSRPHPVFLGLGAAVILWLSGRAAAWLGAGLLPEMTPFPLGPAQQVLGIVLQAYFNTYGWGLMVCALAVGVYFGVEAERRIRKIASSFS